MAMDLAAALAALDGAATIAKSLRNIEGQLSSAELKLKMADLTDFLADARIELAEAKVETGRLNERIKELETFIAKRDTTVEEVNQMFKAAICAQNMKGITIYRNNSRSLQPKTLSTS